LDKVNPDITDVKPEVFYHKSTIHSSKILAYTWIIAITYLGSIGMTEYILFYLSVTLGLALYFTILIALTFHSTLTRIEEQRNLLLALGLVPLIRIVSSVISIIDIPAIILYILIGIPVFTCIYILTRHLKYTLYEIGLNIRNFLVQVVITVSGIGLGILDYLILKPDVIAQGSLIQLILSGLVLLIFSGFMEELIFRGILQRASSILGWWGWVFIVCIYATLQIGYGSLAHIVFTFGVSLYFSLVVLRTKSIIGVSLAHGLINITMFLVMPGVL
jgi:uncharacterized protein